MSRVTDGMRRALRVVEKYGRLLSAAGTASYWCEKQPDARFKSDTIERVRDAGLLLIEWDEVALAGRGAWVATIPSKFEGPDGEWWEIAHEFIGITLTHPSYDGAPDAHDDRYITCAHVDGIPEAFEEWAEDHIE